jgi:hypothetical protein
MLFDETDLNRYSELDISDWIGSEANILILLLLRRSPKESESVEAFERLACTLVQWWNEDDQRNGRDEPVSRSQKALVNLPMLLADYVLRIDSTTAASVLEPILLAVDQHPKEVAQILQGIVSAEDSKPSITKFWPVWQEFADRIKAANWLLYVDSEYAGGSELMATIFLTRYWKKNIRHWKGLSEGSGSGNAHNVHQLFKDLPATSILFECYCSFLFQIGESCLPSAFKIIAEKLSSGNSLELLRRPNTLFHLEALIRRYVYGRPIELKSDRDTREAVMLLLDSLIEAGSSSSYRMRDDFVTPLPVEV